MNKFLYLKQSFTAPLIIWLLTAGLLFLGAFEHMEHMLMDSRFAYTERNVSDSLVIVDIDAISLRDIDSWPWPRSHHATLLNNLIAAGATEVAFDIDFSGKSKDPATDQLFADAIEAANGRVILPVFAQNVSSPSYDGHLTFTNAPLAIFSEHALLGNVNVKTDHDGYIRDAVINVDLGDGLRPSMAALLAGTSRYDFKHFSIDFGIMPKTFKKIRYSDVFKGDFDQNIIKGRKVIVGATAIELGDYLAVPEHGVLPGVVLQALVYESLIQDRAIQRTSPLFTLILSMVLVVVLSLLISGRDVKRVMACNTIAIILILLLPVLIQFYWPVSVDTVALLSILVFSTVYEFGYQYRNQALLIFRQRISGSYRRALMDRIVEHSFDGLILTDNSGHIKLCNDSAVEIIGGKKGNILGRPINDFIALPDETNTENTACESTGTENRQVAHIGPLELDITRADGADIIIELSASHLSIDRRRKPTDQSVFIQEARVYTFRDITARRRAADSEREAKEAAIASSRAKTEFLANMSHELRTPLNAIIGFSDILNQQMFGPLGHENYLEYSEDINHSGKQLLSVLNDILDVARIEVGEYQINEQMISVNDPVLAAKRITAGWPILADKTIIFELEEDLPTIVADTRLIKQMLMNILSNSAKFTDEGGHITVRVFSDGNSNLIIEIEDDGIGIPEDKIENLTEAFFQVDSSLSRLHDGTGLGLTLVAAYAKLHNGNLHIESTKGVGTTIRVILPVEHAAEEDIPAVSLESA